MGWRQKVLQPPRMLMLLSWWCPFGHDKRHLPATQIFIAVRLIPILTPLSSRWTVPLIWYFLKVHLHHLSKIKKSPKEVAKVEKKIFRIIFAWWWKDPDPYLWLTDKGAQKLTDPDPEHFIVKCWLCSDIDHSPQEKSMGMSLNATHLGRILGVVRDSWCLSPLLYSAGLA